MPKIMIFGSNGRLGRELCRRFSQSEDHDIIDFCRDDLDLTEISRIPSEISYYCPDAVINASAFNGIEQCKNDPSSAILINATAVAAMAAACKARDIPFVHYSTDYVFSGDNFGLFEDTPINPWGLYGKSKRWGEEATSWCAGKYFVFRLSSIYGFDISGVLDPLKQAARGKGDKSDPIRVLPQICAPASTRLVADATFHALRNLDVPSGIYHLTSSQPVWKIQFAEYLLNLVNRPDCIVKEGVLADPRPIYSVLVSRKFADVFNYQLPDWRTDLELTLPTLELPEGISISEGLVKQAD
jgi:dTDP-4-dehydrorhamnose reductase